MLVGNFSWWFLYDETNIFFGVKNPCKPLPQVVVWWPLTLLKPEATHKLHPKRHRKFVNKQSPLGRGPLPSILMKYKRKGEVKTHNHMSSLAFRNLKLNTGHQLRDCGDVLAFYLLMLIGPFFDECILQFSSCYSRLPPLPPVFIRVGWHNYDDSEWMN